MKNASDTWNWTRGTTNLSESAPTLTQASQLHIRSSLVPVSDPRGCRTRAGWAERQYALEKMIRPGEGFPHTTQLPASCFSEKGRHRLVAAVSSFTFASQA